MAHSFPTPVAHIPGTTPVPLGERLAWGILAFFGAIFGFASVQILSGVARTWNAKHELAVADVIGGAVFSIISLCALVGAIWVRHKTLEQHALRQREPERPWRWRRDWLVGRIDSDARTKALVIWIFTTLWNLMSLPVWLGMAGAAILFAWIFPAVGLVLLFVAVRTTLQTARYGRSTLVLRSVPGVIGGAISGEVHAAAAVAEADELIVRLSCVRRQGRNQTEEVWQEEVPILRASATPSAAGTALPFAFTIPYGLPATDDASVSWHVQITGRSAGPDYRASFEVPVFETTESSPDVDERAAAPPIEALPIPNEQPVRVAETSRIRIAPHAGGVEIVFPPFRTPMASLMLLGAWLFWNAIGLMFFFGWDGWSGLPPKLLLLGGSLFLAWALLESIFARVRLRATAGRLEFSHRWLFLGRTRTFAASEITDIELRFSGRLGRSDLYDLRIDRVGQRKCTLARAIKGKALARSLRDRLERSIASQ